jgi:hypothetical protein
MGHGMLVLVDVTLVKASGGGADRDRAYLELGGAARRVPVHVVHDLPHLAVESLFGIEDGLWAELAAGGHAEAARAATARDPGRAKQGRIVSGAATASGTEEWLSPGHRTAKAVTNCVANRFGDGPDTPAAVRARLACSGGGGAQARVVSVDDETIALAILAVQELDRRWAAVPPGGTLRLSWPLTRDDPDP